MQWNDKKKIIYNNSVSLYVTEVLGGGGRERPVKQQAIFSVSLSVEVLKPSPSVHLLRS